MKKIITAFILLVIITPFAAKAQSATQKKPVAKEVAGKAVYTEHCVTCHQLDGAGVGNLNPTLIKTSYVLGDKARLIDVILNGMNGQEIDGEMYSNAMPAFTHLTDKQIADVLTYVRSGFGNKASAVTAGEVARRRSKK